MTAKQKAIRLLAKIMLGMATEKDASAFKVIEPYLYDSKHPDQARARA